ncbi:tetratricopeptide repeat protein [Mucilaginibacter sp.]|uniref:tetratricopeptide repeat protein n=1 Tax=Mucilaginibacter sp. TaxID=1882438 RepID=UPI003D0B97D5
MNTYYTVEEKYLQAIDKLGFGRTPKALQLLNEIVSNDPLYARAHFQLGNIYYYEINDYQTAGYHFKTCMELEPGFPDNYFHYLKLVVFLNMEKQVHAIAQQALNTAGVNTASIYDLLGLFYEKNKNWTKALKAYQDAFIEATKKVQRETIEESIERVQAKIQHSNAYQYHITE